jgi:hypothetical protein
VYDQLLKALYIEKKIDFLQTPCIGHYKRATYRISLLSKRKKRKQVDMIIADDDKVLRTSNMLIHTTYIEQMRFIHSLFLVITHPRWSLH